MGANGNKTIFTDELADAILERLSGGESLRSICSDRGMPSRVTVLRWVSDDVGGFARLYEKAREMQAHSLAEDILEIADDARNDWMLKNGAEDAGWLANGENVNRSRLRVDTRKWIASKIFPKVYGDKNVTELSGPDGGPIKIEAPEDTTPSIKALLAAALPPPTIEGSVSEDDAVSQSTAQFIKTLGGRPKLSE